MYTNPENIRKHIIKICLNDDEWDCLNAIVEATGEQRQVVARHFYNCGVEHMDEVVSNPIELPKQDYKVIQLNGRCGLARK
jgi:hypothetical protein